MRIYKLRIIGGDISRTRLACSLPAQRDPARRWIASIKSAALDDSQGGCRIRDRASVGTHRILDMRDRYHPGTAG